MAYQIDTNLLRGAGEEALYGSKVGRPIGAGNAVSREEMVAGMPFLKDLDFKVTVVQDGWVQVWLKTADYNALIDGERKADAEASRRVSTYKLFGLIAGVLIQTVVSSVMIGLLAVGADYLFQFEAVINFWTVFWWTALAVFILSVITSVLGLMTGKTL